MSVSVVDNYRDRVCNLEKLEHWTRQSMAKPKDEEQSLNGDWGKNFGFDFHYPLVSRSPEIKEIFKLIKKVSKSNASILIQGETGTGKELIASLIQFISDRSDKQFVKVNCAALPENLLESELFGHEKGAFTSADSMKKGLMELAHNGSFFFDEICEAPHAIQVKLLRVLQEKEFNRVGGTKPIKVDLRIIAATNRDLIQAVKDKVFRADLYYRLNVISIHIPPIRERQGDIPLLIQSFLKKYNDRYQRNPRIQEVDPEALKILEKLPWPGNVRELENVIERAVVLAKEDRITVSSLPEEYLGELSQPLAQLPSFDRQQSVDLEQTLGQIEKKMIVKALDLTGGIMSKAAKLLNLNFRSMRYRISKYKIKGKFDH